MNENPGRRIRAFGLAVALVAALAIPAAALAATGGGDRGRGGVRRERADGAAAPLGRSFGRDRRHTARSRPVSQSVSALALRDRCSSGRPRRYATRGRPRRPGAL